MCRLGDPKRAVDGCRQCLGSLRIRGGIAGVLVGGADDPSPLGAAAGEEDGLT